MLNVNETMYILAMLLILIIINVGRGSISQYNYCVSPIRYCFNHKPEIVVVVALIAPPLHSWIVSVCGIIMEYSLCVELPSLSSLALKPSIQFSVNPAFIIRYTRPVIVPSSSLSVALGVSWLTH